MEHKKLVLLENLQNKTFCDLGVSKVHGVGVFAIKDIPEKTNPFLKSNMLSFDKCYLFSGEEMAENLSEEIILLIKKFQFPDSDGCYPIPANGMNSVNLSFYVNHSDTPNMVGAVDYTAKTSLYSLFSTREIKVGEELFLDYRKEFGEENANKHLNK